MPTRSRPRHWTKSRSRTSRRRSCERSDRQGTQGQLEAALGQGDHARVAMLTGLKVIHISERDTQIADRPKEVDEFVNTCPSKASTRKASRRPRWVGARTNARCLPGAHTSLIRPRSQICIAQPGMNTLGAVVVPLAGDPRMGDPVTARRSRSPSTSRCGRRAPAYRPTCITRYLPRTRHRLVARVAPCATIRCSSRLRIMNDEILTGRDELGVLLMGTI